MITEALEITSLVAKGVSKLTELIPLWFGASTPEQKAAVIAEAKRLVDGLNPKFDALDAKDAGALDALQAEITAARGA